MDHNILTISDSGVLLLQINHILYKMIIRIIINAGLGTQI